MYYKLKPEFLLRGWERLPYAIVRRPKNQVQFLRAAEFQAVDLCDGRSDCDSPIIPAETRRLISLLLEQGYVEALEQPGGLEPEQAYRKFPNRFIRTAHWSVTGRCNYRCKHCYMSAPQAKLGELPHETVMDIIGQLADCGIMRVSLTGGEPLVRNDFADIVAELSRRHIYITTVFSNGRLVDEELLTLLESYGQQPEFNFSYDGDQGWHDWLRGVDGASQAVLAAFDLCQRRGFSTGAELCLHQGNKHLLRPSLNTLAAHGCGHVKVNPVAASQLWSAYDRDYSLSLAETYQLYLDYIPHFFADGRPLGVMLGGFFSCGRGRTDWRIPLRKYDGGDGCLRQTVCGHARQTLYISPESRMLPCLALSGSPVQYDYPLITDVGLRAGLTGSAYMRLIDTRVEDFFRATPACGDCEFARVCAGGCRASALALDAAGGILGPDQAACLLFKGGYPARIQAAAEAAIATYCPTEGGSEHD